MNSFAEFLAASSAKSATNNNSSKEKVFPVVDGKVVIDLDGQHFVFTPIKGVFIHDAIEMNGIKVHALKGIGFDTMCQGIFSEVYTSEMADSRMATCFYLSQLQKAIDEGKEYVSTLFGLKYIYRTKEPVQAKSNISWKDLL